MTTCRRSRRSAAARRVLGRGDGWRRTGTPATARRDGDGSEVCPVQAADEAELEYGQEDNERMAENKTKTFEQQRSNIPAEFMKDVRTEAEFWNRCKALEERYGIRVKGVLERNPWRATTNFCDRQEDT